MNCLSGTAFNTKWGCNTTTHVYHGEKLNVHITYENNTRIFPASSLVLDELFYYELPGFNGNSPEIVFNSTPTPLSVVSGQKFRIWYGEDLSKFRDSEKDNNGTSCTDVYAFRQ